MHSEGVLEIEKLLTCKPIQAPLTGMTFPLTPIGYAACCAVLGRKVRINIR